jgi:glycosyltransferase involved in cell wall biosynthesis
MWESTLVPAAHVEEINRTAALQLVPCSQNVDSFRDSGIRVPIEVLHHGIDPDKFPFLERHSSDIFTFGTFGDLSPRKGVDVLMRAFSDEFKPAEPVRLLMKSNASIAMGRRPLDKRISVLVGSLGHDQLLEFLRQMDVFVMPSRGEGFGLCGLEAMATGLPLIATNWSGPAEYLDAEDSYPLAYRLMDANGIESNHVRYYGLWAEPEYEHLRYLMRWTYEHPEETRQKGRIAAQRVHAEWTWDRIAKQLRAHLDIVACE